MNGVGMKIESPAKTLLRIMKTVKDKSIQSTQSTIRRRPIPCQKRSTGNKRSRD